MTLKERLGKEWLFCDGGTGTILQEKGNLHLYEKLGYRQTGKTEKISDLMDIVYYEKN